MKLSILFVELIDVHKCFHELCSAQWITSVLGTLFENDTTIFVPSAEFDSADMKLLDFLLAG